MKLPLSQVLDPAVSLLITKWKSIIDPLLANPANNSLVLPNLSLVSGNNTINHMLGRVLKGWIVVGNNSATTFYDLQSTNQHPSLSLILHASGPCKVNLLVF